ncbi:uncharacterized protein LOC142973148 [Anticarsia gemmatalis]|uniref:uncharacterized protein LOC142973148 n=1 Tax=Anticarsia gemmatalis TaxID=129554 RepID=UPI003F75D633
MNNKKTSDCMNVKGHKLKILKNSPGGSVCAKTSSRKSNKEKLKSYPDKKKSTSIDSTTKHKNENNIQEDISKLLRKICKAPIEIDKPALELASKQGALIENNISFRKDILRNITSDLLPRKKCVSQGIKSSFSEEPFRNYQLKRMKRTKHNEGKGTSSFHKDCKKLITDPKVQDTSASVPQIRKKPSNKKSAQQTIMTINDSGDSLRICKKKKKAKQTLQNKDIAPNSSCKTRYKNIKLTFIDDIMNLLQKHNIRNKCAKINNNAVLPKPAVLSLDKKNNLSKDMQSLSKKGKSKDEKTANNIAKKKATKKKVHSCRSKCNMLAHSHHCSEETKKVESPTTQQLPPKKCDEQLTSLIHDCLSALSLENLQSPLKLSSCCENAMKCKKNKKQRCPPKNDQAQKKVKIKYKVTEPDMVSELFKMMKDAKMVKNEGELCMNGQSPATLDKILSQELLAMKQQIAKLEGCENVTSKETKLSVTPGKHKFHITRQSGALINVCNKEANAEQEKCPCKLNYNKDVQTTTSIPNNTPEVKSSMYNNFLKMLESFKNAQIALESVIKSNERTQNMEKCNTQKVQTEITEQRMPVSKLPEKEMNIIRNPEKCDAVTSTPSKFEKDVYTKNVTPPKSCNCITNQPSRKEYPQEYIQRKIYKDVETCTSVRKVDKCITPPIEPAKLKCKKSKPGLLATCLNKFMFPDETAAPRQTDNAICDDKSKPTGVTLKMIPRRFRKPKARLPQTDNCTETETIMPYNNTGPCNNEGKWSSSDNSDICDPCFGPLPRKMIVEKTYTLIEPDQSSEPLTMFVDSQSMNILNGERLLDSLKEQDGTMDETSRLDKSPASNQCVGIVTKIKIKKDQAKKGSAKTGYTDPMCKVASKNPVTNKISKLKREIGCITKETRKPYESTSDSVCNEIIRKKDKLNNLLTLLVETDTMNVKNRKYVDSLLDPKISQITTVSRSEPLPTLNDLVIRTDKANIVNSDEILQMMTLADKKMRSREIDALDEINVCNRMTTNTCRKSCAKYAPCGCILKSSKSSSRTCISMKPTCKNVCKPNKCKPSSKYIPCGSKIKTPKTSSKTCISMKPTCEKICPQNKGKSSSKYIPCGSKLKTPKKSSKTCISMKPTCQNICPQNKGKSSSRNIPCGSKLKTPKKSSKSCMSVKPFCDNICPPKYIPCGSKLKIPKTYSKTCVSEKTSCESVCQQNKCKKTKICACGAKFCKKVKRKMCICCIKKLECLKKRERESKRIAKTMKRMKRFEEYAKQDYCRDQKEMARHKKKMEDIEKCKDLPTSLLCAESLIDLAECGVREVGSVVRSTCRYARHPKDAVYKSKVCKDPCPAKKCPAPKKKVCQVRNTTERIQCRFAHMTWVKYLLDAMESCQTTNYLLHIGDKDASKRCTTIQYPEQGFDCSAYVASLRTKPYMWVYNLCPWFYPHCISFRGMTKQCMNLFLFLLAMGLWTPCILCTELLRYCLCCLL